MRILFLTLPLLILTVPLARAQGPAAAPDKPAPKPVEKPYALAGSERSFGSLQQAVNALGEDGGTIVIADGVWRDCAVQVAGRITYRAASPGKAVFDGSTCEDKATLVLRGAAARVEGLVFRNIQSSEGARAGVRLEKGDLDIAGTLFRDSQQGLVTADDPAATIRIDRTSFSGLGQCAAGQPCAHGVDIGKAASLAITRSRFERGRGGHYLRSRAARATITGSSFDDTRGKGTRYMIDLPDGSSGSIRDNIFVQGRDKADAGAFIALAAASKRAFTALEIAGNEARITPGVQRKAVFLADWSSRPQPLGANRLGPGVRPAEKRPVEKRPAERAPPQKNPADKS